MYPRGVIVVLILAVGVLVWVPKGVFSRFTNLTESETSQHEPRVRLYSAAIKHFPEYGLAGVGISHFWGEWGRRTEFARASRIVTGAHNCFVQVTIYWGLAGLLAFLMLVWQTYRCLPKRCGVDPLSLCLLGIAIQAFVLWLFSHHFEAKEFSLALSLLASSSKMTPGGHFSAGRAGIATKKRYAFGILRQGFQRRPLPDAMPTRHDTRR